MEKYDGPNRRHEEWHLKKEIPIGIVFMLGLQLIGGIWFAAGVVNQQENNTKAISDLGKQMEKIDKFHTAQRVRVWDRLNHNEEKQQATDRTLSAVDAKLGALNSNVELLVKHFLKDAPGK